MDLRDAGPPAEVGQAAQMCGRRGSHTNRGLSRLAGPRSFMFRVFCTDDLRNVVSVLEDPGLDRESGARRREG